MLDITLSESHASLPMMSTKASSSSSDGSVERGARNLRINRAFASCMKSLNGRVGSDTPTESERCECAL